MDNQQEFDKSQGSVNEELLELKSKFTKMESDLSISRNVNVHLVECLVVTERKCWANEQYWKRECLETSSILESVSDNAVEDKIERVLCGIDVELDPTKIESCHSLKERK